jgi:hypothetical protein
MEAIEQIPLEVLQQHTVHHPNKIVTLENSEYIETAWC